MEFLIVCLIVAAVASWGCIITLQLRLRNRDSLYEARVAVLKSQLEDLGLKWDKLQKASVAVLPFLPDIATSSMFPSEGVQISSVETARLRAREVTQNAAVHAFIEAVRIATQTREESELEYEKTFGYRHDTAVHASMRSPIGRAFPEDIDTIGKSFRPL